MMATLPVMVLGLCFNFQSLYSFRKNELGINSFATYVTYLTVVGISLKKSLDAALATFTYPVMRKVSKKNWFVAGFKRGEVITYIYRISILKGYREHLSQERESKRDSHDKDGDFLIQELYLPIRSIHHFCDMALRQNK